MLTLTYIIAVTQWPCFGKQGAEVSPNIKHSGLAPSYSFKYLHEVIKWKDDKKTASFGIIFFHYNFLALGEMRKCEKAYVVMELNKKENWR